MKPFLKWVGGKGRLVSKIQELMPNTYRNYHEPFVGGGALMFALQPNKAFINDSNEDLINVYKCVRNDLQELINSLHKHYYEKEYYYKVRALDTQIMSDVERASRFIFLNKTCFNGLYRVNKKGKFNVPFGKYTNPKICDVERLTETSEFLQKVNINCKPFEEVCKLPDCDDFVYFDPPYVPLNTTSNFTNYTKSGFGLSEQELLADILFVLTNRKVKVMISNSDTEITRTLYKNYNINSVMVNRTVSSKGSKRKKVSEIIVTNY